MKDFLRLSVLNAICLFSVSTFYPGLIVPQSILDLLIAGAVFSLINYLVKPIIKLFLLPINLVTLGLFRWLANVLILLILVRLVPTVQIVSFISPPFSRNGFAVPSFSLNFALSLILTSFFLSLVFNFLDWLLAED